MGLLDWKIRDRIDAKELEMRPGLGNGTGLHSLERGAGGDEKL